VHGAGAWASAASALEHLAEARAAYRSLDAIVRSAHKPPPLAPRGSPDKAILVSSPQLLVARDVTFRHEKSERDAVPPFDLVVRRGERLLLQGPSGSGKSTLAALLASLHEPTRGELRLSGATRADLGTRAWRRRIVLAPQFHENHVFGETLAFNLLMGGRWPPRPDALAHAEALCIELGLGPLLDRMPGRLDQLVGDSAWQLSHGERSRVFVARALLQEPELLILDESFGALDPEMLACALECVWRHARTLLVIAHP
jgi:ATP-binding cassette subfamily B protein